MTKTHFSRTTRKRSVFRWNRWCKNVLRPDKHARSVRSLEIGLAGLNLTSELHGFSFSLQIVFVSCREREREDGELREWNLEPDPFEFSLYLDRRWTSSISRDRS